MHGVRKKMGLFEPVIEICSTDNGSRPPTSMAGSLTLASPIGSGHNKKGTHLILSLYLKHGIRSHVTSLELTSKLDQYFHLLSSVSGDMEHEAQH